MKRHASLYSQFVEQIANLKQIIEREALSHRKKSTMTWESYFWGESEIERYCLPIK